jgi:3-deoxy-7-phosphoheptulonate synthase
VLGAVGVRPDFDTRDVEVLPGVREVVRITQPYKLASRAFRPEGTVVEFAERRTHRREGNCRYGRALRGGIRRADQSDRRARGSAWRAALARGRVQAAQRRHTAFRAWASRVWLMRDAADKNGLLVVSEVMDPSQIPLMLPYVDMLQVGARNMQNYHLLRALGK